MKIVSPLSTDSTVDFSSAVSTKSVKSGTTLPATCAVGELFFETDAVAGQNLWLATATNVWTQLIASGGAGNVTAAGTLTANLPVIGAGTTAVAVGTRSGNTTEFVSQSGAKTAGKQTTYDADGNLIASAYDTGVGTSASTILHHTYNTDVVGDDSANQVWVTYTAPGGTFAVGDIVEVRCALRLTAGLNTDRNIAMYFGNGSAPGYGFSLASSNVYWFDWIIGTSSTALVAGIKANPTAATNPGIPADHATDASSLNLASTIVIKMATTGAAQLDNTHTVKIVYFTITRVRPA